MCQAERRTARSTARQGARLPSFFHSIPKSLDKRVLLMCLRSFSLLFCLRPLGSDLSWSWHPSRNMIARAIFAFLILNESIIHMHIILHGGQIFMSEQLLQAKGI